MVDGKSIEEAVDMLLDEVDNAAREKQAEERRTRIERVIEKLTELRKEDPSSVVSYALGYALYAHPDRLSDGTIFCAVNEHLSTVLQSKPNDALSWMYLGHNAYDVADFEVAWERFHNAAHGDLPDYLALKVREMQLCCRMSTRGLAATIDELETYVVAAERNSPEDIWPQELARMLGAQRWELSPAVRSRLVPLLRRLDRAGAFGTWFSELFP